MAHVHTPLLLVAFACALAACGGAEEAAPQPETDPLLRAALDQQIMIDPDLVAQNRAASVANIAVPDGSIPVLEMGPKAVEGAREQALELVGGVGALQRAPEPQVVDGTLPHSATLTAAARAAAAPGEHGPCADRVTYTALWAARLPDALAIYPQASLQEAAGTDEGGCALRVVNFQTPVPLGEVVDFYYTQATRGGYKVQHVLEGRDSVLGGVNGRASFVLYARTMPTGATEVDLVVSGGMQSGG